MIPGMETKEDFNASGGELLLYELLAQLPDEYYVFHSTRWNEKLQKSEYADAHRYIQWGEADFTIFHPAYGFIVFEVKDGQIAFDRQRGWIQINRYSGHEKIIDPMEQAERSKYYFLEQIKRRFGGYPLPGKCSSCRRASLFHPRRSSGGCSQVRRKRQHVHCPHLRRSASIRLLTASRLHCSTSGSYQ